VSGTGEAGESAAHPLDFAFLITLTGLTPETTSALLPLARSLNSGISTLRSAVFMSSAFDNGTGSGSALDPTILRVAAAATIVATLVSATSIFMHLKNYRKPILQR